MTHSLEDQRYTKSERFEIAFNQIHLRLQRIDQSGENRFIALLHTGRERHKVIEKYFNELKQYAKLRNSLVHYKTELGTYIAEPHEEVVERIEDIASIFNKPNYALSIATQPVISFDVNESISQVIAVYTTHRYSQYPVYAEGKCIGLIKMGDVLCWLMDHFDQNERYLREITIASLLTKVKMDELLFVNKSIDVFTIEDLFSERHRKGEELEVVLITENGKKDETPLGIISSWNLIEIDYNIE